MKRLAEKPRFTRLYPDVNQLLLPDGCTYVFARSVEERSLVPDSLGSRFTNVRFVNIAQQETHSFTVENDREYSLRSKDHMVEFARRCLGPVTYLDISGLRQHVWASVLQAACAAVKDLFALYVEPADYEPYDLQTKGWVYDLGAGIQGVAPLPGFTRLTDPAPDDFVFIPLLGFEGARFAHLLEVVQPLCEQTFPVVGVPGFRPEYPYRTFLGNRQPLESSRVWRNVRYVTANCPFEMFYLLSELAETFPRCLLKVAPIGTKPHALGALLYAIRFPERVEVVYDHPVRKTRRTLGRYRLFEYHLSPLA